MSNENEHERVHAELGCVPYVHNGGCAISLVDPVTGRAWNFSCLLVNGAPSIFISNAETPNIPTLVWDLVEGDITERTKARVMRRLSVEGENAN